jgi:uncharacterized cupredoxin-like copper-binding protein
MPILAVALLVDACGSTGSQSNGSPTEVELTLSEFKIDSPQTSFTAGTPYHFVINNEGTISHDWAIMPRGETDESQLPPGTTVARELAFTQAGDFEFACHIPGHYEAGILLPITVQ